MDVFRAFRPDVWLARQSSGLNARKCGTGVYAGPHLTFPRAFLRGLFSHHEAVLSRTEQQTDRDRQTETDRDRQRQPQRQPQHTPTTRQETATTSHAATCAEECRFLTKGGAYSGGANGLHHCGPVRRKSGAEDRTELNPGHCTRTQAQAGSFTSIVAERLRACAGGAQALKVRVVFAMFDRGRGLADASAELTRGERISMCTVPMLVGFALVCASSNATEP